MIRRDQLRKIREAVYCAVADYEHPGDVPAEALADYGIDAATAAHCRALLAGAALPAEPTLAAALWLRLIEESCE